MDASARAKLQDILEIPADMTQCMYSDHRSHPPYVVTRAVIRVVPESKVALTVKMSKS